MESSWGCLEGVSFCLVTGGRGTVPVVEPGHGKAWEALPAPMGRFSRVWSQVLHSAAWWEEKSQWVWIEVRGICFCKHFSAWGQQAVGLVAQRCCVVSFHGGFQNPTGPWFNLQFKARSPMRFFPTWIVLWFYCAHGAVAVGVAGPAYLGVHLVWQCRFTQHTWRNIASTEARLKQLSNSRTLFNYAIRVGRTALHPEILIYIRLCHVVRPEGLLKVLVLRVTGWDLRIWKMLKEITWARLYPNHTSWMAIAKSRNIGESAALWKKLRSYFVLTSKLIREKLFKIQNWFRISLFQNLQQSLLILGKELHTSPHSLCTAHGELRCWCGVWDPLGAGDSNLLTCALGSHISLSVSESC